MILETKSGVIDTERIQLQYIWLCVLMKTSVNMPNDDLGS